jgi:glycosyltransferase involved in cell wall biosynthesis
VWAVLPPDQGTVGLIASQSHAVTTMSRPHRVSVVTISFNQAQFLSQSLESVHMQDYPDVEHIVVDAGSTDGSDSILRRYSTRLSRLIVEPDQGPADGLNKGFAEATGDIFAYVNADDALLPGALSSAVQAFIANPWADVVHAHSIIVTGDGIPVSRFRSSRFDVKRFVYGGVNLPQQSTVFQADAFSEVEGFNVTNRTCWDAELAVDLALAGRRFCRVNEFWSIFRIHPQSISGSGRLDAEYRQDQDRLRAKVSPSSRNFGPWLWRARARLTKFLADPQFLIWRMADEIEKATRGLPAPEALDMVEGRLASQRHF